MSMNSELPSLYLCTKFQKKKFIPSTNVVVGYIIAFTWDVFWTTGRNARMVIHAFGVILVIFHEACKSSTMMIKYDKIVRRLLINRIITMHTNKAIIVDNINCGVVVWQASYTILCDTINFGAQLWLRIRRHLIIFHWIIGIITVCHTHNNHLCMTREYNSLVWLINFFLKCKFKNVSKLFIFQTSMNSSMTK